MKPFRAAFAAAALLFVAPLVLGQPSAGAEPTSEFTPEVKSQVLDRANYLILNKAYVPGVDFSKWTEYLASEKDKLDAAKTEDEFAEAFQSALGKFSFSHLALYTPRMATARVTQQTVGIGIRINQTPDGILVVGLIEGAPAAAAGIEVGDLVLEANGQKVTGPAQITGPEGTQVTVKVKKSDGKMKEYTITRKKFSTVRPEVLNWADKDTAVLSIYTFDLAYDSDRVESLMKQAAGAKRLIVDLRGNGGGAVINLMHFLGTVLPDNTVMGTFVDKALVDQFVAKEHGSPTDLKAIADWSPQKIRIRANKNVNFKGEVAVLVDGGSGSASEIAAAALKEALNAPVVGVKSAGAVLVSVMRPLPDGFVLQMPIDDYVTSKGVRLEGTGVVPDHVMAKMPPYLKKGEKDPTWKEAITLLKSKETAKNGN